MFNLTATESMRPREEGRRSEERVEFMIEDRRLDYWFRTGTLEQLYCSNREYMNKLLCVKLVSGV